MNYTINERGKYAHPVDISDASSARTKWMSGDEFPSDWRHGRYDERLITEYEREHGHNRLKA